MKTLKIPERREELLTAAEKLQKEQFEKRVRALEKEYQKEENRRAVIQTFEELASSWNPVSIGAGNTKKAASLGITYLLSSILTGTYEMKLYLMGEEFWLEEEPLEATWRPMRFFEYYEEDMESIVKKLKNSFPRLCRAEEDAVRLRCADYYLAAICKLCKDMAEEIVESKGFREMEKRDDFFLFFGGFHKEGEILWRMKRKNDGKDE
ncbi:MAG: hypothetical protein HDQ97_11125 [Lachnospiraceae bacterium]|nr:hypothetical protein [Lachnospiraceae bacterium]